MGILDRLNRIKTKLGPARPAGDCLGPPTIVFDEGQTPDPTHYKPCHLCGEHHYLRIIEEVVEPIQEPAE